MGHKYGYPTYNPLITTHEPPSRVYSKGAEMIANTISGVALIVVLVYITYPNPRLSFSSASAENDIPETGLLQAPVVPEACSHTRCFNAYQTGS